MALLFFLMHFHDPVLLASWKAKLLISSHFPLIYNIKHIVFECPYGEFEQKDLSSLHLIPHEGETVKNALNAGFVPFMTRCVLIKICQKIMENGGSTNNTALDFSVFLTKDIILVLYISLCNIISTFSLV